MTPAITEALPQEDMGDAASRPGLAPPSAVEPLRVSSKAAIPIAGDAPITVALLHALLLAAQDYPGEPAAVMRHLLRDLMDGERVLDSETWRLEWRARRA